MGTEEVDCSCNGGIIYDIIQCKGCSNSNCGYCSKTGSYVIAEQKRIWNTVRVPASEYSMNKAALTVAEQKPKSIIGVNWNQMSDRALAANSQVSKIRVVPSHGNSTKRSLTRHRPGSQAPGGKGVDIKHGSYDRYLARLKGKGPLRTQNDTNLTPVQGNKTKSYGIVNSRSCLCFT